MIETRLRDERSMRWMNSHFISIVWKIALIEIAQSCFTCNLLQASLDICSHPLENFTWGPNYSLYSQQCLQMNIIWAA